jgi:CRP/FNR family cyclic AMP-dependent transcriptional regulator
MCNQVCSLFCVLKGPPRVFLGMKPIYDVDRLILAHPFLSSLEIRFALFYQDCSSIRRFASRQAIFFEGGKADHFYLIVTGRVVLQTFVSDEGMVTIQSIGPGEALGWSWLFEPYKWHFTARTEEPTEVISLDAAALREKAAGDPEFRSDLLMRISKTLAQRLHATRQQLMELMVRQAPSGQEHQYQRPESGS